VLLFKPTVFALLKTREKIHTNNEKLKIIYKSLAVRAKGVFFGVGTDVLA